MREADAPHSRLSIMPSAAMEMMGEARLLSISGVTEESFSASGSMRLLGISPTTARRSKPHTAVSTVARMMDTSEPGTFSFHFFGQKIMNSTTNAPTSTACHSGRKPRRA